MLGQTRNLQYYMHFNIQHILWHCDNLYAFSKVLSVHILVPSVSPVQFIPSSVRLPL